MTTGLRYVRDDAPGFSRRRSGKGFSYLDRRGTRITSRHQIDRINALAIPPAWTDVWIRPDANGHLQATGRDAKGREQDKYQRMIDFGTALPSIRKQVAADYRLPGIPQEKVVAVVVHLLESSLIRGWAMTNTRSRTDHSA